ncbi:hypothetical protein ACSBR2_013123 [Camellia fascicularis]
MVSHRFLFTTLFIVTILLSSTCLVQLTEATRPRMVPLLIQSILRGKVPPTGPNPCTYIPGKGTGTCT